MIGHTETDELSVLDVLGDLRVKSTSHSVIISVLKHTGVNIDSYLPALPGKITRTA